MRRTGLIVPSAFDTCAKAAIFVRDESMPLEGAEVHLARVVDRRDLEHGLVLFAQQLPRHDVGVVLEPRDQHLVAGADVAAAVALRHQVDRLRGAAQQDHLAPRGGAQEAPDRVARVLVGLGRERREAVHAAVDVRVVALVHPALGVDHGLRLLGARRRVEVDERVPVHGLLQHRELAADRRHVVAGGRSNGAARHEAASISPAAPGSFA
jgi:hypothetical protein